ncbi:MAG TPA: hypothetical protein VKY19_03450 [Ktedonosporobacter sp.]|jgi:hypothetical protein|nr:hypothetical protein [Ktedonosporobacter sp.]
MATNSKQKVHLLLDIQRPAFAEHYERGVWWSMYGDEQGHGPLSVSYLITNLKQYQQQPYFEQQDPYRRDLIGFFLGMYHGGVLSPQTGQLRPEVRALICFDHPQAIRGYQRSREAYFHEPGPPYRYTEQCLLDLLHEIVREAARWNTSEAESTWNHALGCLLGELSGALFPETAEEQRAWCEECRKWGIEQEQDVSVLGHRLIIQAISEQV